MLPEGFKPGCVANAVVGSATQPKPCCEDYSEAFFCRNCSNNEESFLQTRVAAAQSLLDRIVGVRDIDVGFVENKSSAIEVAV